jgi:hypothetical protein
VSRDKRATKAGGCAKPAPGKEKRKTRRKKILGNRGFFYFV